MSEQQDSLDTTLKAVLPQGTPRLPAQFVTAMLAHLAEDAPVPPTDISCGLALVTHPGTISQTQDSQNLTSVVAQPQRIPHMPTHVLTAILAYLPDAELRQASALSRKFYDAAHGAGLTLHRRITAPVSSDLETFNLVVGHARSQHRLFRLALTLVVNCTEDDHAQFASGVGATLATIRNAMSKLVSLRVAFPSHFAEAIYNGLREGAPFLRELELVQTDAKIVQLPVMLLGGKAPKLHKVTLIVPALDPAWPRIPAFKTVRSLNLLLRHPEQRLAVSRFFPNLEELHVVSAPFSKTGRPSAIVDVSGMTLHRMTVNNDAGRKLSFSLTRSGPRPTIAAFEYLISKLKYEESVWPTGEGELNAHIQYANESLNPGKPTELVVALSSADLAWRHTLYTRTASRPAVTTLTPLETLPPFRTRLVSLTVDESMLVKLVQTPVELAGLRELFADFTRLPNVPRARTLVAPGPLELPIRICMLRCPALTRVMVFATNDKPVAVSCPKIVTLGRLLRQSQNGARAELVLVRVQIDLEKERAALENVFSSVRVDDGEKRLVPEYYHPRGYDPRNTLILSI